MMSTSSASPSTRAAALEARIEASGIEVTWRTPDDLSRRSIEAAGGSASPSAHLPDGSVSTAGENRRFLEDLLRRRSDQIEVEGLWADWRAAVEHVLDGQSPDQVWHDILAVIGFAAHDLLWRQRACGADAPRLGVISLDLRDLATVCWNWGESAIRDEIAKSASSSIIPVVKAVCAHALTVGDRWVAERSARLASA
jgi:hypothetical protein